MLTKENYIEYRKKFTDQVSPEMLHEYYLDHNNSERNLHRYGDTLEMKDAYQFERYFMAFLHSLPEGVMIQIVRRVLTHFDKKFNVEKVLDAEGNVLIQCVNDQLQGVTPE